MHLPTYSIETSLGRRPRSERDPRQLAGQSDVPAATLALVDRHTTMRTSTPWSRLPRSNAFLKTVVPFLEADRLSATGA